MGQPEPAIPLKGRGRGTNPSGIAGSSYIPSLDGLRAASILIVLLSHAGASCLIPGGFGVTVFFFLSGFLITTLLTREHDRYGSIALGAFYLRRLVRLGPPLLACLLLAGVAAMLGLAGADLDRSTLVSQILFYYNYHSLLTGSDEWVNGLGILWSLSVEEHFYLIWPALFIAIGRRWIGLRHLIVLLVALLVWRSFRYFVLGSSEWSIYISTDTRFDSLLYGCVLALMHWRGVAGQVFPTGRSALALLRRL
ncbi:acyltransferase family protein [Rubellimicrobium rubrum]|uniref:acyltransferase family protein n=1 Tax=Rubellimicrobium rubrum TaxID=2585369 RepID=UPI00159BD968|nr:acyltransferase [Rubellimicrobium rubrum]